MICIGIDTGVHTGVAVWDSLSKSFIEIQTTSIHKAMDVVRDYKERCCKEGLGLIVRVEDPRQRKWFGTERISRDEERKRLQGVGSVKRDASIWDDFLRDLSVEYEMIPPRNSITKLRQDSFRKITGWEQRTSEHSRDAAMLVFMR